LLSHKQHTFNRPAPTPSSLCSVRPHASILKLLCPT
jgi:hypothetical protein